MQIKLPHWYLVLLTACHTLSDYICTRHVAACSDGTRACSDTKSRSARRECHDGGQRPALCSIPENGSSGKSSLIPAYGLKKEKDQCVLYLNMFYPSQGVPVMAIRNKMVLEGLDPNLLEWVFYIKKKKKKHVCIHVDCLYSFSRTWQITFPSLLMTANRTPPCPMEQRRAQRIRMLLPPALTASRLSVTDICPPPPSSQSFL